MGRHVQVNPPNSALASSLSHSLAPSTAPSARQPAASGKTNGPSLRKVTSNSSLKSSAANPGKPRALAAAARKKEQVGPQPRQQARDRG